MAVDSHTVPVGGPAPDFTLPTVGGSPITLGDQRGRPIVLVFLRGFG